jgi:hypothetical protein
MKPSLHLITIWHHQIIVRNNWASWDKLKLDGLEWQVALPLALFYQVKWVTQVLDKLNSFNSTRLAREFRLLVICLPRISLNTKVGGKATPTMSALDMSGRAFPLARKYARQTDLLLIEWGQNNARRPMLLTIYHPQGCTGKIKPIKTCRTEIFSSNTSRKVDIANKFLYRAWRGQ